MWTWKQDITNWPGPENRMFYYYSYVEKNSLKSSYVLIKLEIK